MDLSTLSPELILAGLFVGSLTLSLVVRNLVVWVNLRRPAQVIGEVSARMGGDAGWRVGITAGPCGRGVVAGRSMVMGLRHLSGGPPRFWVQVEGVPSGPTVGVVGEATFGVSRRRLWYRERVATREVTRQWVEQRLRQVDELVQSCETSKLERR